MNFKHDNSGVSPVIGVILMVAVTVALVALVTVIVFDIGGDVSESPDATVDIATDSSGTTNTITMTVLRNENVDSLKLSAPDGSSGTNTADSGSGVSAGDTLTLASDGGGDGSGSSLATSGTAQVIATMSDGSEQVLTSTDYDFS